MADETKITGTGETPAPESHEPVHRGTVLLCCTMF